jgi:hypothetical protein
MTTEEAAELCTQASAHYTAAAQIYTSLSTMPGLPADDYTKLSDQAHAETELGNGCAAAYARHLGL